MIALHCICCGVPIVAGSGVRCDGCDLIHIRKQRQQTATRIRDLRRAARAGQLPSDDPTVIRYRSRDVARKAKQRGEIVPQPCACCGDPKAQMHHPDYEEPRLIVWLCGKHHHAWHAVQRQVLQHLFDGWLFYEEMISYLDKEGNAADAAHLREFRGSTPAELTKTFLLAASYSAPNASAERMAS